MQEFVDSLNLPFEGSMINNQYIVDVETSNDFSELYNCVALNKSLSEVGTSVATVDETRFSFTDGAYQVNLEADYNKDIYRLTVEVR